MAQSQDERSFCFFERRGGVPKEIEIGDGTGRLLSDTQAAALAASCQVTFSAIGAQPTTRPACMNYDAPHHQFVYSWKLAKSPTGSAAIKVQVAYPGGGTTTSTPRTITIIG